MGIRSAETKYSLLKTAVLSRMWFIQNQVPLVHLTKHVMQMRLVADEFFPCTWQFISRSGVRRDVMRSIVYTLQASSSHAVCRRVPFDVWTPCISQFVCRRCIRRYALTPYTIRSTSIPFTRLLPRTLRFVCVIPSCTLQFV